jgi:integrase
MAPATAELDAAPITPQPAAGTVDAYLSQWLAHAKGRVRGKTYEGYGGMLRLYLSPALGGVPLRDLTPLHLQDLYSGLLARGLSGGTVLNLHLVLVQAFGQAARWGLVAVSPAAGVQPPRPRRPEMAVVDAPLAERILGAVCGTSFELPVAMAICTGMRRGEILGLRWKDLDPDYSVAHVRRSLQTTGGALRFEEPKTRRSRRAVDLPETLRPYLDRQKAAQGTRRAACPDWSDLDLVIDGGNGRPVNPDTLSSGWYRFARRRGLPHIRFHDLRHAHATLMLLQGVHPKVVSERLGHASVGITLDTYSHVLPTMQAEAVRAFDSLFTTPHRVALPPAPAATSSWSVARPARRCSR